MKTKSMLNTIKFSEFPLEFSRPLVSLFFFVWISPVVLSLFWSVMPTKGHCTIAKILLMLSWSFLFWTPCEAMLSFMHQFFIADWNPVSHFVWTPRQDNPGECRTAAFHLFLIPIWAIEYPFTNRQFYACHCGRKSHWFQSAATTGQISANFCKFLPQTPSHCGQLCYSFQALKIQAKITFNILIIGKEHLISCSVLQLSSYRLKKCGTVPSLSMSLTSMVFKTVPSL